MADQVPDAPLGDFRGGKLKRPDRRRQIVAGLDPERKAPPEHRP